MKKLLIAFSALALVFSSCSTSSTDPDPSTSTVLVSKIIYTTQAGVATTTNYNYNANKLTTAVSSDGYSEVYTYNGDLITKMEEFQGTATTPDYSETYTYNTDAKVASYTTISYGTSTINGSRYVYVYNIDNTISITKYTGNATSQTLQVSTGKAFFTNGQITKVEVYYPATATNSAYTNTQNYVYDTKLNAANNITGFSKLILQGYDAGLGGNAHNLLSATRINGTTTTSTDVSTFTYNASDYPVMETNVNTYISTPNSVHTSTQQFFY
jgi:hypothetical protein